MKKIIISLSVVTILFACNSEQKPKASTALVNIDATADSSSAISAESGKDLPVIQFEKTAHDFGKITQGEHVEYNFKFRNTGNADLLIASANASCGCTVPEYPKEPIKPGQEGLIKVKFNSEFRLDAFEKSVVITANTNPLETVLLINGFINPKPGGTDNTVPNNFH